MSTPEGLAKTVAGGNLLASLVAARDFLAGRLEVCDSDRDVAALTARLLEVMTRIDAIPAAVKGTPLDELAERRANSDAVTARPARARRG